LFKYDIVVFAESYFMLLYYIIIALRKNIAQLLQRYIIILILSLFIMLTPMEEWYIILAYTLSWGYIKRCVHIAYQKACYLSTNLQALIYCLGTRSN